MSESKNQSNKQEKSEKSKSGIKIFQINFNPLFILVVAVIVSLMFGSMINSSRNETVNITISEFISKIKNDELSRVNFQNSGEILSQPKYVYIAENISDSVVQTTELTELSQAELIDLITPKSTVEQLTTILRGERSAAVEELLIGEDYAILRTGENAVDYMVNDTNEDLIETALEDKGIELNELDVIVTELVNAQKTISASSFESRFSNSEFVVTYNLGDVVLGRVPDKDITIFSLTWDAGIASSLRIIQEEGISLDNENITYGSVIIASVPWGDIISLLMLVGLVVLGYFIFRGIQNSGSGLMRFGQSKARMFWGVKPDITFKDVAGVDEAKNELEEIVEFLKTPEKFRKLGARIPKGVLMVGRPGTGKTLLARAVAGEAGVPFFHTSGSEFEEMLVGAGASRVRDLFEKAKKAAPALIFIDEIDAVARKRGTTIQSSTTEQTLNQILVEMDGFETDTNVIVIAATNRPDVLDPAILRPGRFDRRVVLDLPDVEGRKKILAVHAENKPLANSVDLEKVAKRTIGFSGAELENTLNEAAIIAAKKDQNEITDKDIEEAASKVTMGPVRKSMSRSNEELKLVAVHEAGHAVVAHYTKKADKVHKVSILSRGSAGGVTHFLPENDDRMVSRGKLIARIAVGLGGRAAEELILEDISTGASSDIQMVTNIAKSMVQKYGMSTKLGLIKYGDSDELEHLGYSYGQSQDYSEDTAKQIDNEVREIIEEGYKKAKEIINQNRSGFDKVVDELLKVEVLDADEFVAVLEGKSVKEDSNQNLEKSK